MNSIISFFTFLTLISVEQCTLLTNITLRQLKPYKSFLYPLPPICVFDQTHPIDQHHVYVSLWNIDPTKKIGSAVIITKYYIETSCTFYFFGAQETSVIKKVQIPCDASCETMANSKTDSKRTQINYVCKWPTTTYEAQEYFEVKDVPVHFSSNGKLWADGKNWQCSNQSAYCISGNQLLKPSINQDSHCPFMIDFREPGLLTNNSLNQYLLSVPRRNLLFSFHPFDSRLSCSQSENYYLTSLGYIISIDFNINTFNSTHQNHNWFKGASNFQTNLLPGLLNAHLNDWMSLHNKLQDDLNQALCHMKENLWMSAFHTNDTQLMSFYISGDLFAISWLQDGLLYISTTKTMTALVNLNDSKILANGLIQLYLGRQKILVEPISGLLNITASRFPFKIGWIPLTNGGYFDVITKQVLHEFKIEKSNLQFTPLMDSPLNVEENIADSLSEETDVSNTLTTSVLADVTKWWGNLVWWGKIITFIPIFIIIGLLVLKIKRKLINSKTSLVRNKQLQISKKKLRSLNLTTYDPLSPV